MADEVPENRRDDVTSDETSTVPDPDPDPDPIAGSLNIDENNNSSNSTSQPPPPSAAAIANSLSTLISTIIKDFDSRAEATINSQDHLASSLNRLNGELDQLLEDAPLPFIMQHATRISGVRKRVSSMNSVLKSVQRRVDNIDHLLSAGVLQDKVAKDSSGQQ